MLYFFLEAFMENQINTGEQNTQPVGQNPTSQPIPVLDKSKTNLTPIIVVATLCSLVFGFGGYYLGKQSLLSQKYVNDRQNQVYSTTTPQTNNLIPTANPSSTPDPTVNWKIYVDDIYKFSFKYPSDWKLNCTNTNLPDGWLDRNICDLVSPKALLDHGQISNGSYFVVGVSKPNPNYANFSEYLDYSSKQYGYTFMDKKINNINGKIGLTKNKETNYLFERNGHIINANWIYSETPADINQILSTFKFTQ
ncbi:hypothetical protein HY948_00600 [Candidatus Gottesmanbacteria bacterium]|nr:hypothetical protein [Candidatus Gottesmanbacteria bacterium]